MNLFTIALCFTLLALSAADDHFFKKTRKECVPLNECPSVWNKLIEISESCHSKSLFTEVSLSVSNRYYCRKYKGELPMIECPDELPEEIKQIGCKQVLSNDEKKKLLEVCGTAHTPRILMAGNNTDRTDYPWLARLQFEYSVTGKPKFLCGGVLITNQHVLTAAHCIISSWPKLISVRLGAHDTKTSSCILNGQGGKKCEGAPIDVEVAESVIYEGYKNIKRPSPHAGICGDGDVSDLALIKLKTKVPFSKYVRPICLPQKAELVKQQYNVAGWSTMTRRVEAKALPQKLHSTISGISGISSGQCLTYPINKLYSNSDHICAGGTSGQACIADVGGPLMALETKEDGTPRMTVFGITFMDLPCSTYPNMPGLFTKVHKYLPWIKERIFQSDV